MKVCAGCLAELSKERFSKKQWNLPKYQRRCKECIEANRELQLKPPPKPPCCICLDEGPDEWGQLPRRACSCRGDSAGFVHVGCVFEYAKQKTVQWECGDRWKYDVSCIGNTETFLSAMAMCPTCLQRYHPIFFDQVAVKFLDFAETKYPGNHPVHLLALCSKLHAIEKSLSQDKVPPEKKAEADEVATKALSIVKHLKILCRELPTKLLLLEGSIYVELGIITQKEGTADAAKRAADFWVLFRDICQRAGVSSMVLQAEYMIAEARAKYESGRDKETQLEQIQAIHKANVENLGEHHYHSVQSNLRVARNLWEAGHRIKAQRLVCKLYPQSKRIFGPESKIAKDAKDLFDTIKGRPVCWKEANGGFIGFNALRYEDGGNQCVVRGPFRQGSDKNETMDLIIKLPVSKGLRVLTGTPVFCHGCSSPNINGQIGQVRTNDDESGHYEIDFEAECLKQSWVDGENITILFELPEKTQVDLAQMQQVRERKSPQLNWQQAGDDAIGTAVDPAAGHLLQKVENAKRHLKLLELKLQLNQMEIYRQYAAARTIQTFVRKRLCVMNGGGA